MENIRQAIERAKARTQHGGLVLESSRKQVRTDLSPTHDVYARNHEVEIELSHLQSHRIVAYDGKDPLSRPFDILRTEALHSMDMKGWKILAITSPTPSCGKTLTAINLALSIGRQPERRVLLVDLDLRKPRVAASLGLKCREGLLGVIEERIQLDSAVVPIRAGNSRMEVLPTAPASNASDLAGSSAMTRLLEDITDYGQSRIIILDLPPLLTGHDVISILPHVDCVLLVGAIGVSTVGDIEECEKHLQATNVVRFVLNKVPESAANYLYY
jgi:protein-tyrosine kinase